jgi:hypothetical protein
MPIVRGLRDGSLWEDVDLIEATTGRLPADTPQGTP